MWHEGLRGGARVGSDYGTGYAELSQDEGFVPEAVEEALERYVGRSRIWAGGTQFRCKNEFRPR